MSIVLYGIANCDTVRKARAWLQARGIDHRFHDLRRDGLDPERVERWLDALGWERLINRRSATWRQLRPEQRADLDTTRACALILAHPTLIRRPLIEHDETIRVGFSTTDYETWFQQ
ncbi:ArsC family reductase [Marichromatium bheemlicum]|uniref:ArsC family reductase n=1 Tax=Marichromatium bheemlicum TaxID=365339 RepID=A0ABX1I3K7_9GAMM|nr:ArsC family reductase [Marichromatium bheemlicum]NKN31922.1 ArsC family reductase [Marichromatium bheemlicum]